jgi:hypothetical protein
MVRIMVSVVMLTLSLAGSGCGEEKLRPIEGTPKRVTRLEYWINPDGSAKVRLELSSQDTAYARSFRSQVLRTLTNTPGVSAWSAVSYGRKKDVLAFAATAWVPDISKLAFGAARVIPARQDAGPLKLTVRFGSGKAPSKPPAKAGATRLTDEEVRGATKTIRADLARREQQMKRAGWRSFRGLVRVAVHAPGRVTASRNLRRQNNGAFSAQLALEDLYRVSFHALKHDDRAIEDLVRATGAQTLRDLSGRRELRDLAFARLWGEPGFPELTVAGAGDARPLFDYEAGLKAARQMSLSDKLAGAGIIKLSLPPAPKAVAPVLGDATIRSGEHLGKPELSVSFPAAYPQKPVGLPRARLHRVVAEDGRVLFPCLGISGSLGAGTSGTRDSLRLSLTGTIDPPPKTIGILAELTFATGRRRGIDLTLPEIKPGAADLKNFQARITKLEEMGKYRLIHFGFVAPEKTRILKLRLLNADGKTIRSSEPSDSQSGATTIISRVKAEAIVQIKTIRIEIAEDYQTHTVPVDVRSTAVKK